MPTVKRILVGLVVVSALGAVAVWALANLVEPKPREMVIKVPQERFAVR